MTKSLTVFSSARYQLVDITSQIEKIVTETKTEEGICLVFAPHSTAAVILTENEEGLKNDWLRVLQKQVEGLSFKHNQIDDNADSHILAGILGQGKTIPIENSRLSRGTWQQIFLVELDGPRERKVIIKILGNKK
jgi:secondary thiamine-phosphate synthase enzyme